MPDKVWDAAGYAADFGFVWRYGEDVLSLLETRPGQSVLDVGCGNGALTARIRERGVRVTGLDSSESMLALARASWPDMDFRLADATSFRVDEPFDHVFSNAVFHWIEDQPGLARSLAAALKPGGRLVCEFGGAGCCAAIHEALARAFAARGLRYESGFYFPTIGQYAPLLEAAGLRVDFAALFPRPTKLAGPDGVADWIRMFATRPFAGLDDVTTDAVIAEAVELARPALRRPDGWHADYVRLRIKATRAG